MNGFHDLALNIPANDEMTSARQAAKRDMPVDFRGV
jgi:hypothetical protein